MDAWSSGKAGFLLCLLRTQCRMCRGVYQVGIVADGAVLKVCLDGARILLVTDANFREGSIAFHTWYNRGSYFGNVVVTDLDIDAVLPSADFMMEPH